MTKPDKPTSPLALAATELDLELRRYDEIATAARKVPLNSEKNLERAAKAMTESADCQERVGERVKAMVEAITSVRQRQEASAQALLSRAEEMQQRTEVLRDLLVRYGALGDDAKAIHVRIQQAAAVDRAAPEGMRRVLTELEEIHAHMAKVVETAREISAAAESVDFIDVARQADALRQQMHAARNKLLLLQQGLARGGA